MPQLVLQLKEGLENGLSYDFVFLSIFLLGKFLYATMKHEFLVDRNRVKNSFMAKFMDAMQHQLRI